MRPDPGEDVTAGELAAALAEGRTTSTAAVRTHVELIEALDMGFGAIRGLCVDAVDQASASDDHRRHHGPRSPLEGIPVLVKDNVDIAGMPTTAGALALEHSVPAADATLVSRLRQAGAVILGKTNLSELANFLTEDMPSGYSSLAGQVLNPYDTSFTPSGSSSGSATAVALGFAPVAVGTETDGSITSPADHQSLVGFKPTVGLISRTGILPIAPSQDTPGPMTKTAADAWLLLSAMAGPDPSDPATLTPEAAGAVATLAALDLGASGRAGLSGVKLAAVSFSSPAKNREDQGRHACHQAALAALREAGAQLVEVTMPDISQEDELAVLRYEFAPSVDRYFEALGPGAPVRSLAALRAWNLAHEAEALKFGQLHVDAAVAIDHAAERDRYAQTRARDLERALSGLESALAAGPGIEAVVFPGAEGCTWAARAGWPSVVVPAGYSPTDRRPVGIMFVSRAWTDARLLELAHAFEQVHPVRRSPYQINPAVFRRFLLSPTGQD